MITGYTRMRTTPAGYAGTIRVASLIGLAGASQALAHVRHGQTHGLLTGLAHPLSGLDHMLAMVAVGLWGAQLGPPALWLLPVTFPLVMSIGGFLAQVGVRLPGVEAGVALSALLLGLMVACEAKPKLPFAAALVAVFATFHGHAHGAELPPEQSGLTYSIGFVISTGCLHLAGITVGLAYKWRAGQLAVRLIGVGIAVGGAIFLNGLMS
jgi:urease accessory protein